MMIADDAISMKEASSRNGLEPDEKLRMRMAAENYTKYKSLEVDSDSEPQFIDDIPLKKDKPCSSAEQILAVLLVVALVVIAVLTALLVFNRYHCTWNTCLTADCALVGGSILMLMNQSADPCVDFHEYACGSFIKNTFIPPEYPKFGQFQVLGQRVGVELKKLLEAPGDSELGQRSKVIEQMKLYYRTCASDEARSNISHLQQVLADLSTSQLVQWVVSDWQLERATAKAHLSDLNFLFSVSVQPDDYNNGINRITFDQPELPLGDYTRYTGPEAETSHLALVTYYKTVMAILGVESSLAGTIAETVWQLQVNIAQILMPPSSRVVITDYYNLLDLHQLQGLMDSTQFNLAQYIYVLLGEELPPDTKVIVQAKPYFGNLSRIWTMTKPETFANFLALQLIQGTSRFLTSEFETALNTLEMSVLGTSGTPDRWKICVDNVQNIFPEPLGGLYVKDSFTEADRTDARQLASTILSSFRQSLLESIWMDDPTRAVALDKLTAVGLKIGYPDMALNVTALDLEYGNLTFVNTSSLDNWLKVIRHFVADNLDDRDEPPEKDRWSMSPTEVNAYYSPNHNEIVFPAAILNKPFYARTYPSPVRYGAMGFVIGHEVTHGFDSGGRLFNKFGNVDNWWTNSSSENFKKQADCLENQYSNYTVHGQHLNGKTTLNENIADNGGLRTSYRAFHENRVTHDQLPGLPLTGDQLFFIAYAQNWCTFETAQYAIRSLTTDPHSFPAFRTIGALSNMKEFSDAFKCPKNSPMNPDTKCQVWT